ncbi:hypothetical protein BPOR_0120g00160 [Botrytis porri]|uniref:Uncharacterized protein n=1 Tax=Botrytis porri TaxID=87229 RepID=A0A4Z1KXG0_9HELO|nr:hypothetical protein BPOR_0120g00160 [Botrytis porri]
MIRSENQQSSLESKKLSKLYKQMLFKATKTATQKHERSPLFDTSSRLQSDVLSPLATTVRCPLAGLSLPSLPSSDPFLATLETKKRSTNQPIPSLPPTLYPDLNDNSQTLVLTDEPSS